MAEFRNIQIPAEDYELLGITADSVIQTYVSDGRLVVEVINEEDYNEML